MPTPEFTSTGINFRAALLIACCCRGAVFILSNALIALFSFVSFAGVMPYLMSAAALHKHEGYCIRFAIRGNAHRTAAFRQALEKARDRFAQERGLAVAAKLDVKADYPTGEVALQAVDYFLWALQRVFEKREDRFLELLWPQCSLIVDVDDTREKEYGAYYTKQKPLRAAALKGG